MTVIRRRLAYERGARILLKEDHWRADRPLARDLVRKLAAPSCNLGTRMTPVSKLLILRRDF